MQRDLLLRYSTIADRMRCFLNSGEVLVLAFVQQAGECNIPNGDFLDEVELLLLEKLYEAVLVDALPDRALTVGDLKTWHRLWLGKVYFWAGQERSVNMSKGDFHFAAAAQVPRLLDVFERDCLAGFTTYLDLGGTALNEAIAATHVEFILIHPFRDGNGRLSRLLCDVMAVQADRDPLDYSAWDADKTAYFSGIYAGLAGNYTPMQLLVETGWIV